MFFWDKKIFFHSKKCPNFAVFITMRVGNKMCEQFVIQTPSCLDKVVSYPKYLRRLNLPL